MEIDNDENFSVQPFQLSEVGELKWDGATEIIPL